MNAVSGWTIIVEVPKHAAEVFDRALAPLSAATSSFESPDSDLWRVEAFAISPPDETALVGAVAIASELSNIPEPDIRVAPLPAIDWVAENQKSFQPISAGRFFIHPTHYDGIVPAGSTSLAVDAGPAFGTGSHGSTLGCLLALDGLSRNPPSGRILDLGCGTGILALAIAKRWRRKVLAADIDPDAVATCRINARLNKLSPLVRVVESNGFRRGRVAHEAPYGLIIANILARPLIEMAADIRRKIQPGGMVILSGFTENQENDVRVAYRRQDYHLVRKEVSDGWSTFVLARFGGKR
ncbi:MAG: 50S ribosomal protein L11 methyltransferase [Pseudomonadota bacterium]|nr:50S ribosomal protein L11 methyltransferase [Pseudomonadota bacterium]